MRTRLSSFSPAILALSGPMLAVSIMGLPAPTLGQVSGSPGDLLFPGEAAPLAEAVTLLHSGRYEEALEALEDLTRTGDGSPGVLRAYARALGEVGRYGDALDLLQASGGRTASVELENTRGEILYSTGKIDEAEAAFRTAENGDATDRFLARKNLAVLLWNRGERDEALALFDSFIDLYNGARNGLSAQELMAVGTAVRYLGVTNPDLFQDALMAIDDAAEVAPNDPMPDILAGELFLEKYLATDARESFRPVLERNPRHPRALLGQARILDFEGTGGAMSLVHQALDVNPAYPDAWSFLASLHLEAEDFRQAREAAERALETNPAHLEALSHLAATHFLTGDMEAYEAVKGRVQALNQVYPDFYTLLAQHSVAQRKYRTAVDFARRAVELDPTSWWSYGVLGMNQLRTGEVEEGRRNLETAFSGDPYNPWYLNSLNLLDTSDHFATITTEHFEIHLHQREAELLGPYAEIVAEEAFAALNQRYGGVPPTPIRLEVYPSHADFSVRTLGIPGLGALGVSFGSTLVMDSPSALETGSFNWLSTMWHEIAHAFHLAMSHHEVPRWFTEGLAVHEQQKAHPRWGHKATPEWLRAYREGRLLPVSDLSRGFVRPEYPEQVIFSYYQASLVFEFIESRWGLDAIVAMMDGYASGKSDSEVFPEVLGQSLEAFDQLFDDFVESRWGDRMDAVTAAGFDGLPSAGGRASEDPESLRVRALANPGSYQARFRYGRALFSAQRYEEAETELRAALRLFPEFGSSESPFAYLAAIHRERGEPERAARALHQLGLLSETLLPVHRQEAELWLEVGDTASAAKALEKAVEIDPFDLDGHRELAEAYEALGESRGGVVERRAILALDPADRAEAHYRLAAALLQAGERVEARTQVLRALEIAPTYEAALDLLLEIRGGGEAHAHGAMNRNEGTGVDSP